MHGRDTSLKGNIRKAERLGKQIGRGRCVVLASLFQSELEADFGWKETAVAILQRAKELNKQQGEYEYAITQYHLAVTLTEYGVPRLDEARAEAEAALATFRRHQILTWEASALTVLGEIQWLSKAYEAVLATAQQLERLYDVMQEQFFQTDAAWLYCLALGLGDPGKALAGGEKLIQRIHSSIEDSATDRYYWAYALALEANQCRAEANDCFRTAAEIIFRKANKLVDDEKRRVHLQSNIFRRWVLTAVKDRGLL